MHGQQDGEYGKKHMDKRADGHGVFSLRTSLCNAP
jgi:hypothetical protein